MKGAKARYQKYHGRGSPSPRNIGAAPRPPTPYFPLSRGAPIFPAHHPAPPEKFYPKIFTTPLFCQILIIRWPDPLESYPNGPDCLSLSPICGIICRFPSGNISFWDFIILGFCIFRVPLQNRTLNIDLGQTDSAKMSVLTVG